MDTAYKAADTALSGRVTSLETAVGTYPANTDSIAERLSDIEDAIGSGDGTSLADRLDTVEGEVDTLQDQMGNYPTGENDPDVATRFTNVESAATTLAGRVTTAEGDIDALETRAGNLEAADVALDGRLDTAESDIDTIEGQIGSYDLANDGTIASRLGTIEDDLDGSVSGSLAARVTTAEGDIDALETRAGDLETELATHDFKYAGSQTENGAADNVVETVTTANEDREVLLASHDKDAVEYAAGVKVNPSTGQLTVNSIKLGAATLTFDTNTESLVVNF
jgi:chromosome segregation ATPase